VLFRSNKNKEKAAELIEQYTSTSVAIMREALKRGHWDSRVDVSAAVNLAKQGPAFGYTKGDVSSEVPKYFDLSLQAEATGKPVAELSTLR